MKRLKKIDLVEKFELEKNELKQVVGGITPIDGGIQPRGGCFYCYTCMGCTAACTICVGSYGV